MARWFVLPAALAGTGAAYAFFASRPPMRVMVGLRAIDAFVPPAYQAAVFASFFAFTTALLEDALDGRAKGTFTPRALLVALTGAASVARLGGRLPLSGHALFLSAVLAFEATSRFEARDERAAQLAAAALGLSFTAWFKLAVWDDARWFAASTAVGAAIGAACGAWARRVR